MIDAKNKVAMISGANRGIGLAIAKKLYDSGFRLSLGSRNINDLVKLNENWDKNKVFFHKFDALDKSTHQSWIQNTQENFGQIDCLVNNAGIMESVSVDDEKDNEEALDKMWTVNVKAPLSLTRLAFPYLRKSGTGRVINVASLAGKAVYGSSVGYSMTKFAAVALSHATRQGGWKYGIRCTAICPGYVATDLTKNVQSVELSDMITADDLAELVKTVVLLSNTASVAELVVNCRPDVVA